MMYAIQYSLAIQHPSFSNTLDAIDTFLARYTTEYTLADNTVRLISSERKKKENLSYLWQELAVTFSSLDEFHIFITAIHSLSPRITVKKYSSSCTLYIDDIPTHSIHAHITKLAQSTKSKYLTIIIDDVGENYQLLKDFTTMPIKLTFAVWPFASQTKSSVHHLQTLQASTIIHFPMEPVGYPKVNPGNGALLTTMSAQQIEQQVHKALLAVPNAIGINNHMGSLFTTNRTSIEFFLHSVMKFRPSLYIVDSLTHPKSLLFSTAQRLQYTTFSRSIFIDNIRTVEDTLQALYKAQRIAQKYGKAIAIGHLAPTTLSALKEFAKQKDSNLFIIPLERYAMLQ
ncbi:MAG: divergent polysaccharide deacetylase family protein [Desulfovibrionaceae bacterium]|nr:divergent polysaccharide deacetylase family protein [Desulfovibrionaceae bacterium]